MKDIVKIKDRTFKQYLSEAEILAKVKAVAARINHDMEGKTPIFLAVLNGAFVFAADLLREITIPCEISFVKLSSYQGTVSTGVINEVIGVNQDLGGRHVIILEDIVDTGLTMIRMKETLAALHPASISICSLLVKPGKLKGAIDVDYTAMEIPDDFIVGYGLDYCDEGRNLRDIYVVDES